LTVPVVGAVKWLPFSNALTATHVQVAPWGIPPFSPHDWPFSAFDGWLWVVSLAPKNVGVVAAAAFPDMDGCESALAAVIDPAETAIAAAAAAIVMRRIVGLAGCRRGDAGWCPMECSPSLR
jgi:hypothetical protein